MKINKFEKVQINAKTLRLYIKVCDRFSASLETDDGREIHIQDDGYVPSFMPGDHYGDYLILDIDIDNGSITNWKTPTSESIENWIGEQDD